MHVLLMTEAYQASLACVQCLGRAGHKVSVFQGNEPSSIPLSKYVANRLPRPPFGTLDAVATQLAEIVRRERIDAVIPISDSDVLEVAVARERFPGMTAFVAPTQASVLIASDKIKTAEVARQLGIGRPRWIAVDGRRDVAAAVASLGFPVVVKLPVSTASRGTFVVRAPAELKRIVSELPEQGRILVEAFIQGLRVDVSGFAYEGKLLDWFAFRHMPGHDVGGTPPYAFSEDDLRLGDLLRTVCNGLNWTGGIDLDLMRDRLGVIYLLEINPRFSGTLVMADKLGIDLPRYYVEAAAGTPFRPPSGTRVRDVLFISMVPNEVVLISRDPGKWQKTAAELRRTHRYIDNLYPDDGPLTIAQMQEALFLAWNIKRS